MCECKSVLFGAYVLCNVILVTSFNIDQVNYAVYGSDSKDMFGFTVAVHKDRGNRGWVLVGAPEAQSQYQDAKVVENGGAVFKCRTDADDPCQEIPFDRTSNVGFANNYLDEKSWQWFGATLSTSGQTDGPVVACAPRYVWFTKDLNRRDPVGTCFVSNGAFDNFEEYSPCRTMNWGYHRQGSCQAGFSAAINKIGDRLYVGAPGSYYWQGQMYSIDAHATFNYTPGFFGNLGFGAKGSVHQQSLENRPAVFSTREGKPPDDDSYMGYSTVVGHFKEGEVYEGIAVGMPRGNGLKGKVLLFTWNLNNYKNITINNATISRQIGSYFGYSIAAADVNGDKKLDLIVGAPMHTELNTEEKYDVGRVYVFYQDSNWATSFEKYHFIDGTNSKSRFGHAVASLGDLNQDGYDDFAVGAPYDGPNGRGAVYIHYGSKEGIRTTHGQVIYAEAVQATRPLTTFGFSLAGGIDLDGNEYPDMAVGAYLANTAFFFRARPVVVVDGFVRFKSASKQIDIKQRNCRLPNGLDGACTEIDFCIKYSGKGIPPQLYLDVQYILDTKKPGTPRMGFISHPNNHTFNERLLLYKDNRDYCKTERVYVKSDIKDKLTPLEAEVKYFMAEDSSYYGRPREPRSQLRPVLDLNNPPSRKDTIVVQKNCGSDNVCIPDLHVNVTSNVEKHLLGSNKNLEFDVIVSNFAEDSFETTFEMKYPQGIFYVKTDTRPNMPAVLCTDSNKTITCEIGNPLPSGKIAAFKVLLQPFHEEGMSPSYEFDVYVNSSNPEDISTRRDNHKHISIDIWIDASLELRGESYPPTVYYNASHYSAEVIEREGDIGPQVTHVYYLTNRGPATIQEAEVFLLWPLTTLGNEDLLYLLDPPHTRGNVKCDAAQSNYRHHKLDYHRNSIWERLKIDTSNIDLTSAQKYGITKNTEVGKGVSSGEGVVNAKGTIDKEIKTSGDSSSVFERRHNESNFNFGSVNANGEYVRTEAQSYTTWVNGVPHTRWENVTTIRDANGKILRQTVNRDSNSGDSSTFGGQNVNSYGNINAQGEYVLTEARYHTTWVDGVPHTEWENTTTVRDSSGKILRTYLNNNLRGEGSSNIDLRLATAKPPTFIYTHTGGGSREQGSAETSITGNVKVEEERNRQEAERLRLEAMRIRQEEERLRLEEEERYRRIQGERNRQEEERIRAEEARLRQEEQRLRIAEEARIREEERIRTEEKRIRQEEERRRQQGGGSGTLSFRSEEERRRYYEELRRRQEESNQIAGGFREGGRQPSVTIDEETILHIPNGNGQYGLMSHNISGNGDRVLTGYFDEQGVYREYPRSPAGEIVYNRTYTVEGSTSIPIDLLGSHGSQHGLGETALGGGFTVQTLDLGTLGGRESGGASGSVSGGSQSGAVSGQSASSYGEDGRLYGHRGNAYGQGGSYYGESGSSGSTGDGGFRRDWHSEGSFSQSGTIPPTYFHNTIERDNVATDRPSQRSRSRGKRETEYDHYAEMAALVKCNSTNCIYIRCVVGALDKNKEIAIALRSRLNVRAIKDLTSEQPIKLSSMMVGKISKLPYVGVPRDQVLRKHEIFTEVPAKEAELVPEVAPLWIYVVSAVAGIVMLLLLIWLLSKCGFFKRNRPSSAPERQPLNRNGYHNGDEAL